ncbi:MAG: DNA replication/repair protein RecF [Hyphomicrobiales bacterium]
MTQVTLTRFRNYSFERLEVTPAPVVLTGPNGAGKTNILEALSLLTPGRGLRSSPFAELACSSATGVSQTWGVAAQTGGPAGEVDLGTSWNGQQGPGGQSAGRQVKVLGEIKKGSGALGDHMRMLWLTPSMDRLFSGPASDRRRFLDRLTVSFDSGHGAQVQAFEKLMRERNRLLENGSGNGAWLDSIEYKMADAAVAVAAARRAAVDALKPLLAASGGASTSGHFPWVEISLEGDLEEMMGGHAAIEVEEWFRQKLDESRERDRAAGRMLSGPHRSDLKVKHGPKGLEARYCSTGEQKALLIGIVLAHARVIKAAFEGYCPILLLDEVAAHLDERRREGLFDEIKALGAQAWMTGTDKNLFEAYGADAQFFAVNDGKVHS